MRVSRRVLTIAAFLMLVSIPYVLTQQIQSLAGVLAAQPEFSNLTNYLQQHPDLLYQLEDLRNITFAAPKNSAFAKLLNSPGGEQLSNNASYMEALLQYHTFNGTGIFDHSGVISTGLQSQSYTAVPGGAIVKYYNASRTLISGGGTLTALEVSCLSSRTFSP